jgi:hypothetical protein
MRKILLLLLLSLSLNIAFGYTKVGNGVLRSNGTQSDTQAAVNAASSGQTVQIPSGSYTWASGVTIRRGITLQGGGKNVTTLTKIGTFLINVPAVANVTTRITGIAFLGDHALSIGVSAGRAPFRVDDCRFDGNTRQCILVQIFGNGPGLIDHCEFSAGRGSAMIQNFGMGPKDVSGWLDDVVPGSANAIYIEDCTFNKNPLNDAYYWGCAALQSFYGARTVVRHCTLNYCQLDQHGTPGAIGARWYEFYENTFFVPSGGNQSDYMVLRAGSGVVFNNHKTGFKNLGGGQIQVVAEEPDYPSLYQVGRGINQKSSPAYFWGNDAEMPVRSRSSNVVLGRDYFVSTGQPSSLLRQELATDTSSTTYSYVPYPYPHPLISRSVPEARKTK